MEKTYLTAEKYRELEQELAELKTDKRREVAERLDFAKSLGDLSENAEYHAAREEQMALESRINEIENLLKNAERISKPRGATVEVGSSLVVRRSGEEGEKRFTIVGPEEADIASGKLSFQSPLGAQLLGRQKGETVTIKSPVGEIIYRIVAIE